MSRVPRQFMVFLALEMALVSPAPRFSRLALANAADRPLEFEELKAKRCAGMLLARTISKEKSEAKRSLTLELQGDLADPKLPESLRLPLEWALAHPRVFEQLYANDVLPTDPTFFGGGAVSVAELFYIHFKFAWTEKIEGSPYKDPPDEATPESPDNDAYLNKIIQTQIHHENGALLARNANNFKKEVSHLRPDLLPYVRPASQKTILLGQGYAAKAKWRKVYEQAPSRDEQWQKSFQMASPGVFSSLKLPQMAGLPPGTQGWRKSWKSFQTIEEALSHLLSGGENSPLLRNVKMHGRQALSQAVTKLRNESRQALRDQAFDSTLMNAYPEKYFVSASSSDKYFPKDVTGNLVIHFKTDRAFEVPVTASNAHEKEFGVPLLINPIEIIGGTLEVAGEPKRIQKFQFLFSEDRLFLDVIVSDGIPSTTHETTFRFRYDAAKRTYFQK